MHTITTSGSVQWASAQG